MDWDEEFNLFFVPLTIIVLIINYAFVDNPVVMSFVRALVVLEFVLFAWFVKSSLKEVLEARK